MITKHMISLNKSNSDFNPVHLSNKYLDVLNILNMFEDISKVDKARLKSPVLVSSIQMFSVTPQCSVDLYEPDELLTVLLISAIDSSSFDLYSYLVDLYDHYGVEYIEEDLKGLCSDLDRESLQSLDSFVRTHSEELINIKSVLSKPRPPRILISSQTTEEFKFLVSYFAKEIFISDPKRSLTSSIVLNGYLASGLYNSMGLPNSTVTVNEGELKDIYNLVKKLSVGSIDLTNIDELNNPDYPDIYYSVLLIECVNLVIGGVLNIE